MVWLCSIAKLPSPILRKSPKPSTTRFQESGASGKPVAVSFVGGERCEDAMKWLIEHNIPTYDAPDLAVKALASLRKQHELLSTSHKAPYKPTDVDGPKLVRLSLAPVPRVATP